MLKILLTLSLLFTVTLFADDSVAQERAKYGPFEALTIIPSIIKGVKYDTQDRIYILLAPDYKDKELIIKLSNQFKAGYRKWENGKFEFVASANRGLAPNEYADWIRTSANYIEYWIEGKLVLHLKRQSAQS